MLIRPRAQTNRLESVLLGPRWFGGVGDGIADDTVPMQKACDYQAARGGGKVDLTGGKWLIDSADLTLGRNVVLSGPWLMPGRGVGPANLGVDYSGFRAVVLVNPTYTIRCNDDSSGVQGLAVFNKNVFNSTTPTTLREGLDRVKLFAGKLITIGDGTQDKADDVTIRNVFVGGGEYGIYADFVQRPRIDFVAGDNTNGIYVTSCFDMDYISNVHFWPFLTSSGGATALATYTIIGATDNGSGLIRIETSAPTILQTGDTNIVINSVGGVTNANGTWNVTVVDSTHFDLDGSTFAGSYTSGGTAGVLVFKRNGIGIHCDTDTDWAQLTNCFCFGYQIAGIKLENSNHATFMNVGVDNYFALGDLTTTGIWIAGTSSRTALIGCKAAAQGYNFKIDSSAAAGDVTTLTGCRSWGSTLYAAQCNDGAAKFVNCHIQTGNVVRIEAAGSASFLSGDLTGVTFSYASGAPRPSFVEVSGVSPNLYLTTSGVSGTRDIARYDGFNSTPTANDSVRESYYLTDSNGAQIEAARATFRATSVTAGAVSGQIFWGTRAAGTMAERLVLATTALFPLTNGGLTAGASGSAFGGLFLSSAASINWNAGAYTITQSSANLIFSGGAHFSPGASQTPANNGQVTFELTNNTTLTFKAKGSDGTVRSGTVTLS